MTKHSTNETEQILVAGAGPVGLFTALLLVEAGRRVIVLEREAELSKDMRASTFHPATLDSLHAVELAAPLVEAGSPASTWQYQIHGTDQRAVFDLAVIADKTDFPFRLRCEQFRLTRLLAARLQDHPLCEQRFAHAATDVGWQTQGDGGESVCVEVTGPAGIENIKTPPYDCLGRGAKAVSTKLSPAPGNGSAKTSRNLAGFTFDLPGQSANARVLTGGVDDPLA